MTPQPAIIQLFAVQSIFEIPAAQALRMKLETIYGVRRWSMYEITLLSDLVREPASSDECDAIVHYFQAMEDKRFFPQSVGKLLGSWTETLDRANMAKMNKPVIVMSATEKILRMKDLERVEARMKAIRANYSEHQSYDAKDREELTMLRKRKSVLVTMLELVV